MEEKNEKDEKDLSVNLGTGHGLVIDPSLNSFLNELNKEYKREHGENKKGITRKLIAGALRSIPFKNSSRENDGEETEKKPGKEKKLYDVFMQYRYTEERDIDEITEMASAREKVACDEEDEKRNTYPIRIPWEVKELILALCLTKKAERTKGEALAQGTLRRMVELVEKKTVEDLPKSYVYSQLLKEDVFKEELVAKLKEQVEVRVAAMYEQLDGKTAEESLHVMQHILPALDCMMIDLCGEDKKDEERANKKSEEQKEGNTPALDWFNRTYCRLVDVRPKVEPEESLGSGEKMTFHAKEDEELVKRLVEELKSASPDIEQVEEVFNEYLLGRSGCDKDEDIKSFVEKYEPLSKYVREIEKWEEIEQRVKVELYRYIRETFLDVYRRNPMPYNYSEYREGQGASAFVRTRCANVHDHIRRAIHDPMRLLHEKSYHMLFFWNDQENRYMNILPATIGAMYSWVGRVKEVREKLSDEHGNVPLLLDSKEETIKEFVQAYNGRFIERMKWLAEQNENLSPVWKEITVDDVTEQVGGLQDELVLLAQYNANGLVLERESQLIAMQIVDEAIEELREEYQLLRNVYRTQQEKTV